MVESGDVGLEPANGVGQLLCKIYRKFKKDEMSERWIDKIEKEEG